MNTDSNDLNRAVLTFLGYGQSSSQKNDRARLIAEFGRERASELESSVTSLLGELSRISVDWPKHSLQSAGELSRAEMHRRHPELSTEALDALAWKFTYDWK